MRKGSKKPTITGVGKIVNLQQEPSDSLIRLQRYPDGLDIDIFDILLRLCDACHDMDTKTELWASIRKDIERLK